MVVDLYGQTLAVNISNFVMQGGFFLIIEEFSGSTFGVLSISILRVDIVKRARSVVINVYKCESFWKCARRMKYWELASWDFEDYWRMKPISDNLKTYPLSI
ncbi:hypothetical protein DICVIV_10299 [Dictyocaulus viviparus]|uniref:Uncharacterized protein n=1 Tax=Dictyocaulus viviparus TaxID=29172 RepID=A0A0D8XGA6_DICVI|nr:hypothetical protein DICVIV_10299 [Dictyocaulus viviparus]